LTDKYFILFSDCIPVKGANRSIICDTRNNNYHFIPNGLYDILVKHNGQSINHVKKVFMNKFDKIIDEYFNYLTSKNIIFFTSNPEFFPKINLKWNSPLLITNFIIDFDKISHDFKTILEQLEVLKCSYIQLRFFRNIDFNFLRSLVQLVNEKKTRIISIDIILPYDPSHSKNELDKFLQKNPRIHSIIIFNSPVERSFNAIREKMGYLMFLKRNILNEKHCGKINKEYFYSNIKLLSESQNYNTCLNRKISVDKYGNIKNCPSMSKSFGNIKKDTLIEALSDKDFKKYWNISKDQIAVCKDCEFRHICTDCRAYVENPEDDYSKPLKCGYIPYTNEWEEWSTSPIKQMAVEHYGMQGI
jgi:SPASM domain peptide maturase of grasp-with-spasm system